MRRPFVNVQRHTSRSAPVLLVSKWRRNEEIIAQIPRVLSLLKAIHIIRSDSRQRLL